MHIIERLMRGMTLEFAITRIFELESKQEYPVNRLMINNYISQLEKGLRQNQEEYYESK